MLKHFLFTDKVTADVQLWRYVPLEQLLSLLATKTLYFCRLDKFEDPWEGVVPVELYRHAMATSGNQPPCSAAEIEQSSNVQHAELVKYRTNVFASCWHEGSDESAAMWSMYSGKAGIAIKTTAERLDASVITDGDFYISRVVYYDFSKPTFPVPPPMIGQSFVKRKSFQHEKEVRAVYLNRPFGQLDKDGVSITVDINRLIESVYISPLSPMWLTDCVTDLLSKYAINASVTRSPLYDKIV